MPDDKEKLESLLKKAVAVSVTGQSLSKSPPEKAPAPAEGQKEQSTRPAEQHPKK